MNIKTIAKNPTAYHNYIIEDKIDNFRKFENIFFILLPPI